MVPFRCTTIGKNWTLNQNKTILINLIFQLIHKILSYRHFENMDISHTCMPSKGLVTFNYYSVISVVIYFIPLSINTAKCLKYNFITSNYKY